ncbi:hypothetical protein F01_410351 [Burkholderia cenocepacia]|nr:hypothetical protein F01_410351 [Burkholderia cenocepacia]
MTVQGPGNTNKTMLFYDLKVVLPA